MIVYLCIPSARHSNRQESTAVLVARLNEQSAA